MAETRRFGLDFSRHDGFIDWKKLLAHVPLVDFVAMRCCISYEYRDPVFLANWNKAGELGLNRIAYHVVYPGESPLAQIKNLAGHLRGVFDPAQDRIAWDEELEHGFDKARHTATLVELNRLASLELNQATHLLPLYSRTEFLRRLVDLTRLGNPLWLAQYLLLPPGATYAPEHAGPPTLPTGRTYLIHQTGHQLPNICATTDKRYQDYNRWNPRGITIEQFFNRVTVTPPPPPPPVVLTLDQRIARLESAAIKAGWNL